MDGWGEWQDQMIIFARELSEEKTEADSSPAWKSGGI
jgi:hypothetical protein